MLVWRHADPVQLEPTFRSDLEALLGPSPYHWVVTAGLRSLWEQALLYGQGRTVLEMRKAKVATKLARPDLPRVTSDRPGDSAHNYGLAVDVVPEDAPYPLLAWTWLHLKVWCHPHLHWGTQGHIERLSWRDYRHWMPERPIYRP